MHEKVGPGERRQDLTVQPLLSLKWKEADGGDGGWVMGAGGVRVCTRLSHRSSQSRGGNIITDAGVIMFLCPHRRMIPDVQQYYNNTNRMCVCTTYCTVGAIQAQVPERPGDVWAGGGA